MRNGRMALKEFGCGANFDEYRGALGEAVFQREIASLKTQVRDASISDVGRVPGELHRGDEDAALPTKRFVVRRCFIRHQAPRFVLAPPVRKGEASERLRVRSEQADACCKSVLRPGAVQGC